MKFLYVDESGNDGESPVFIMVGILIDAYNLRTETKEYDDLFKKILSKQKDGNKNDFKSAQFFKDKKSGVWSNLGIEDKKEFARQVTKLLTKKNDILYAIVLTTGDHKTPHESYNPPSKIKKSLWVASGIYLCNLVQKKMSPSPKNRGNTVIIFDQTYQHFSDLTESLYFASEYFGTWLNGLHSPPKDNEKKKNTEELFDQIINTPFSIKSDHSHIIQACDYVCHVLSRYLILTDQREREKWTGERDFFNEQAKLLLEKRVRLGKCDKNSEVFKYYAAIKHSKWDL